MKAALIVTLPLVALLANCGETPATLPADAVARAATCGVVAANNARATITNINTPLSASQQGAVLRYALLAGAEGDAFEQDRTAAVVNAMPTLGADLKAEDIAVLTPQCAAAYQLADGPVALPGDPLTAGLGCDELSDFMRTALGAQRGSYKDESDRYFALNQALDKRLGPILARRGVSGIEASQAEARKAMAAIVKLGEPTEVLAACEKRYVAG